MVLATERYQGFRTTAVSGKKYLVFDEPPDVIEGRLASLHFPDDVDIHLWDIGKVKEGGEGSPEAMDTAWGYSTSKSHTVLEIDATGLFDKSVAREVARSILEHYPRNNKELITRRMF